jgi:hypothetical protein
MTQDVLYVRLAPRKQDRSVPMPSMDARPLYRRQLGETMGALTRSWKHITLAMRSSCFPWVKQKPLHCVTGYGPQSGAAI